MDEHDCAHAARADRAEAALEAARGELSDLIREFGEYKQGERDYRNRKAREIDALRARAAALERERCCTGPDYHDLMAEELDARQRKIAALEQELEIAKVALADEKYGGGRAVRAYLDLAESNRKRYEAAEARAAALGSQLIEMAAKVLYYKSIRAGSLRAYISTERQDQHRRVARALLAAAPPGGAGKGEHTYSHVCTRCRWHQDTTESGGCYRCGARLREVEQ